MPRRLKTMLLSRDPEVAAQQLIDALGQEKAEAWCDALVEAADRWEPKNAEVER